MTKTTMTLDEISELLTLAKGEVQAARWQLENQKGLLQVDRARQQFNLHAATSRVRKYSRLYWKTAAAA
jgi:hypothetical protein